MRCVITSSENQQKFKEIASIILPAFSGELQILPGHAESFITLREGEMLLEAKGKTESVPIKGGICYVESDTVSVIL